MTMAAERFHILNGRSIPDTLMLPPLAPTKTNNTNDLTARSTMAASPSTPPQTSHKQRNESIEILIPASPTSTMDVFLLTDDDHIQHVRSPEETTVSCFYVSDDDDDNDYYARGRAGSSNDIVSLAMSVSSFGSSLDDKYEYFAAPSDEAVRIPNTVHTRWSSDDAAARELNYTYSHDMEEDNEDSDDDLLGLGCLPDTFCGSLGGIFIGSTGNSFLNSNHQHKKTIMGM